MAPSGRARNICDPMRLYCLRAYQKQERLKATLEGPLAAYYTKVAARPAVKAALEFEKLDV